MSTLGSATANLSIARPDHIEPCMPLAWPSIKCMPVCTTQRLPAWVATTQAKKPSTISSKEIIAGPIHKTKRLVQRRTQLKMLSPAKTVHARGDRAGHKPNRRKTARLGYEPAHPNHNQHAISCLETARRRHRHRQTQQCQMCHQGSAYILCWLRLRLAHRQSHRLRASQSSDSDSLGWCARHQCENQTRRARVKYAPKPYPLRRV